MLKLNIVPEQLRHVLSQSEDMEDVAMGLFCLANNKEDMFKVLLEEYVNLDVKNFRLDVRLKELEEKVAELEDTSRNNSLELQNYYLKE